MTQCHGAGSSRSGPVTENLFMPPGSAPLVGWKVRCFQGVSVRARGYVYGYECVFGRKQPDDLKMDFLDEYYV